MKRGRPNRILLAWARRPAPWEVLLLLVLPATILWIVGASTWTPPNTPDSEFYLSLGAFGHDVTARALNPAYYWTRLGVVAPMRLFTKVFGVEVGLWAWRWLLITMATVPTYFLGRRLNGMAAGTAAALFVLLNTVFITVVGNTYPTGAIVALLVAEGTLLSVAFLVGRRSGMALLALAGVAIGWIAMCNQIAALFALFLAFPFVVMMVRRDWRTALLGWGLAAVASVATFLCFLWSGTVLFPGLDWIETTRYWATAINAAAFRAPDLSWLSASPNLLVLAVLLLAGLVASTERGRTRPPVAALAAGLALCVSYAGWNDFVAGGSLLETAVYVAMLWGPGLALGATLVATLIPTGRPGWIAVGVVALASVLVGTFWTVGIAVIPFGVAVSVALVAGVAAWRFLTASRSTYAGLAAAVLLVAGVQALQNGTPLQTNIPTLRIPYSAAYRPTLAAPIMQQDVAVERWVIGNTAGGYVLVWSPDPTHFGSVGAMSLNGPNALSMTTTVSEAQIAVARSAGPAFVLTLAGTATKARELGLRLRALGLEARSPTCRSFEGVDELPTVYACVTAINSGP